MSAPEFEACVIRGIKTKWICWECREHGVRHLPTGLEAVWCEHHRAGALWGPTGWRLIAPATREHIFGAMMQAILESERLIMEANQGGARN